MSEVLNLDTAFQKVGEFGRMQVLLTFVTAVFRNTGNYMYYTFAYLVLEQKFLCRDPNGWGEPEFESCPVSDICEARDDPDSELQFKVDTSYEYYFENWYTEMDLMCVPAAEISLIVTAYYVCFALGGVFCMAPEQIGRKKSVMISAAVSLVAQTLILLSNSMFVRTICFGLMGLATLKNSVSYVWLTECVPESRKPAAFCFVSVFDAVPMAVFCFYISYIDKSWQSINLIMVALGYIALLLAFVCPESPRWHLVNGRTKEAIDILNYISEFNKKTERIPENARFIEGMIQNQGTRENSMV